MSPDQVSTFAAPPALANQRCSLQPVAYGAVAVPMGLSDLGAQRQMVLKGWRQRIPELASSSTNLLRLKPARLVPPSTLSPMGAARPGWQSQQNCGPGPNGACRFCPLARSAFQKRSAKNMG